MKIKKKSTAQLNALVFIIGLFFILLPVSVHASWWNPSWGYRNTVDITGSASDLTDYQVKVTANFVDGKMKSDFSDIRFVSSDDVTLLSHWKESYTSSSTAEFWVKVPSIPTSGTMIYMYYDNPSANSASNGEATFDFFDKFEPSSSKWTGSGFEHSATGEGYVYAYKTAPGSVSSDLVSNVIGSGDFKAHLKIKSEHYKEHNNCGYELALKRVSDSGEAGLDPFFIYFYSNFVEKSYTISGDNLRLKLYAYAQGCEYTITLRTGSSNGLDDQCSGNNCDGLSVNAPNCPAGYNEINYYCEETSFYDPCCHGGCGAGHDCYGTTCREYRVCKNPSLSAEAKLWIDDLYVRKYALPEPVASFGTEESGCTINGGSCSEDDDCCSGHCKPDYDGTGKFCAATDQCVHDGSVYSDGADAPVCFNGCTKRYCNSGTWSTADCGSYTCSFGSCSATCSQVCGATCDENEDCMPYCTGNTRYFGGACNPLCTCSYSSEDCNNYDDNAQCNGAGLCDKDYYCSGGDCLFNWKNCDSCLDNDYIIDDNMWRDYTGCTPVAGLNNDHCGHTDRTCAGNDCIDLSQFPGDVGANACIGSCTFQNIDGEANNELCSLGDWIGAVCFGASCTDDATDDTADYQCIDNDGCCPTGCNAVNDNDCSAACGNGVTEPGEDCDNAVAQYQCGSSIGKGNDGHEWKCDSGTTSCKWVDQACKDGCPGFCSNCALLDLDCSLPGIACIRDLTGNCGRVNQYYGSSCAGTEICQSDSCESLGVSVNSVTPPSGTHLFNADIDTVVSFTTSGSYSGSWGFLVECSLIDPVGCRRDLNEWVSASSGQTRTVTLTETADVSGTWTLDYCLVYTDFVTNGGWGDYAERNDMFFVCFVDGQPCSVDSDCCSGHCADDYDGVGSWCEPPTSCAHDAVEYLNGAIAPDCFTDGCSEWHCNSGTWGASDCGSYTCTAGSCTLACSQVCGASCDEDSDCTLSNACGDIPGGSLCTPLQWEIITSYDCNDACMCDYTSTCYDADDLKEACEICTGNVWDPITSKCCGDDGVSDTWCNSGNGACVSGIWYPDHCSDGVQDCDELEIDCSDEDGYCCTCDGQSCLVGDECCAGSCVLGACMVLEDIEIHFADNASGSVTLVLGSQSVLVLKVRNKLPTKDTIRLQLLGSPDMRIVYWSKFSNNDKSIDIEIAPDEEVAIPISIFAGQVGIYELKVFAESLSYNSLIAHGSRIIYITSDDDSGLFSRSPGLSS